MTATILKAAGHAAMYQTWTEGRLDRESAQLASQQARRLGSRESSDERASGFTKLATTLDDPECDWPKGVSDQGRCEGWLLAEGDGEPTAALDHAKDANTHRAGHSPLVKLSKPREYTPNT